MNRFLFILICAINFTDFAQQLCPIIPTPSTYNITKGELYIHKEIFSNDYILPKNISNFLRQELDKQFDISYITTSIGFPPGIPKILFRKVSLDFEIETKDYYSICVNEFIEIEYTSDKSCFYAVNSLLQLIEEEEDGGWYIKNCKVIDSPKFEWRGLHLDVSRHFFSVDDIKKFIEIMSLYKFNTFHWHLTDDQGWRIEIKKYPELTKVGAYRDSTLEGHYSKSPRSYIVENYGGFYTQEEIKDIISYAQSRYINIVPEIEMPGHSRAALAAYPYLSCNGLKKSVPGLWGIFDDIYCSKEETIIFMQNVLKEVIELFPYEYIHIGGDEAPKKRWKFCLNCQKVIKSNGLKDEQELQSYFIKRIDNFLTENGKKLIGWDEILEGGISPNATVMSWRGDKGGKEAASQGHYVVMSPNTHCYFDYYQSSHPSEPLAIGGFLPLGKVYDFNPIPEEMNDSDANYILGGQGNLWSEYMLTMEQVQYMAYPRSLALIQNLWCFSKPSYDDFLDIYLYKHEEYLKKHNVNYSKSIHLPQLNISRKEGGINLNFTGAYKESKFDILIESPKVDYKFKQKQIGTKDFIYIPKANFSERVPINLNVKSISNKVESTYNFIVTDILGAKVRLLTPANQKYNNNGSLNLVDGIHGRIPWKGSEWLGFNENSIQFLIDLEQDKDLNGFRIGFLEDKGSWIYLPEKIQVFKSNDNINWVSVFKSDLKDCETKFRMKQLLFKCKTRYLKVEINSVNLIPEGENGGGHIPWTFIDEIEMF